MRWTVVLVAETENGQRVEQPLLSLVRDQQVVLEHLGLTLAEGKRLLHAVEQRMVAAQVKRHGAVYRRCGHCRRKLSPKGYQRRWFRSAFGIRAAVQQANGAAAPAGPVRSCRHGARLIRRDRLRTSLLVSGSASERGARWLTKTVALVAPFICPDGPRFANYCASERSRHPRLAPLVGRLRAPRVAWTSTITSSQPHH
jgi:hypothetical protein